MRSVLTWMLALTILGSGASGAEPISPNADVDKIQRLVAIELADLQRTLVEYRNTYIVENPEGDLDAYRRAWGQVRREHARLELATRDPELSLAEWTRLLEQAREIGRRLTGKSGQVVEPRRQGISVNAVPANDDCASATVIGNGIFNGDTTEATNDGSSYCGGSNNPDIWFSYTAPAAGDVAFSTAGSNFDTVLSLHPSCPGTMDNQLDCDDDDGPGGTSRIVRTMASGETILVRIGGYGSGSVVLTNGLAGAIEGVLTEFGTGTPIKDEQVEIWLAGDQVDYAYTDATGGYSVTGLSPGSYTVKADTDPPYLAELYDDIECHDYSCDPTSGTAVVVTDGATATGIDFVLDRGGVVTGSVTAQMGGAPLANARIEIFDGSGYWVESTYSLADGRYQTERALPTGSYTATAEGQGRFFGELYDELYCPMYCDETLGTSISVSENNVSGGVNFTLLESGAITGHVAAADSGLPLSSQVELHELTGDYVMTMYPSSAGNYGNGSPLLAGAYLAVAEPADGYLGEVYSGLYCGDDCNPLPGISISVTDGSETSGIDFVLPRSAAVTGTVTAESSGQPLSTVYVYLYDESGSYLTYGYCDLLGQYFINDGIEPGTYFAFTWNNGSYFDEAYDDIPCDSSNCAVALGTPITVGLGEVRLGVDFALSKATAACPDRPKQIVFGNVYTETREAYSALTVVDAHLQGYPTTLRAGERVSFSNETMVSNQLEVILDPVLICP